MKQSILSTIIFLTITMLSYSQVSKEWVARYNGDGNNYDEATSLAVDSSGNVYVTGASIGIGTSGDYATIKYNSKGVQQWIRKYNGPGNEWDYAVGLLADDSGNVYVFGHSAGNGTSFDYATIKYNSSGVEQWVQRYNGPGNLNDIAQSLAVDDAGNVYLTGYSFGSGTGYDYATIKYNSSGIQQWVQRYNGADNEDDQASAIAVDATGNVYVTGSSFSVSSGGDYTTIKYNSSGVPQWVQKYNGPGNDTDATHSIAIDKSGNVYVTGESTGMGTSLDYFTIKYDPSGDERWAQRYSGSGNGGNGADVAISMSVDNLENVYVTGYSLGDNSDFDYLTIKYNSSGTQQWIQVYNGPGNKGDYAHSHAVDGSGNVYVTGHSDGDSTRTDYATIKYNSSGVQQWIQRYNGPGNAFELAHSVAVDVFGSVYVTGYSREITAGNEGCDYVTVKYSRSVGVSQINNSIPEGFSLSQNYPNPFNPTTVISYTLIRNSFVVLKVYDVLGKEVALLVNESQSAGNYITSFDGTNLSSGIYYYKIKAGSFEEIKKMTLIK